MTGKRRHRRPNATGRNESEQYLKISYDMARSAAWRSLGGTTVKVWVELRTRYNGRNNGDLSLSLDEGARLLGIGKTTVQRALKELQDKGFIKMVRQGQWYGRIATTWQITDRGYQGHPPTNDWAVWRPPREPKKFVRRFCNGTYPGTDGPISEPKH